MPRWKTAAARNSVEMGIGVAGVQSRFSVVGSTGLSRGKTVAARNSMWVAVAGVEGYGWKIEREVYCRTCVARENLVHMLFVKTVENYRARSVVSDRKGKQL